MVLLCAAGQQHHAGGEGDDQHKPEPTARVTAHQALHGQPLPRRNRVRHLPRRPRPHHQPHLPTDGVRTCVRQCRHCCRPLMYRHNTSNDVPYSAKSGKAHYVQCCMAHNLRSIKVSVFYLAKMTKKLWICQSCVRPHCYVTMHSHTT